MTTGMDSDNSDDRDRIVKDDRDGYYIGMDSDGRDGQ